MVCKQNKYQNKVYSPYPKGYASYTERCMPCEKEHFLPTPNIDSWTL
jgi:hypothetical protein